jgi:hypothetical protein
MYLSTGQVSKTRSSQRLPSRLIDGLVEQARRVSIHGRHAAGPSLAGPSHKGERAAEGRMDEISPPTRSLFASGQSGVSAPLTPGMNLPRSSPESPGPPLSWRGRGAGDVVPQPSAQSTAGTSLRFIIRRSSIWPPRRVPHSCVQRGLSRAGRRRVVGIGPSFG